MILYPTETIYGLGVNALSEAGVAALYALKGRPEGKGVSWLVRDVADMERWGELSPTARRLAARFLPGPLTLVVPAASTVPEALRGPEGTVSFRISSDPVAARVVADFMAAHDAPLTATSANLSGQPTLEIPAAILAQFGDRASLIDTVVDAGPRRGVGSTVVRVVGEEVTMLREGAVPAAEIIATAAA